MAVAAASLLAIGGSAQGGGSAALPSEQFDSNGQTNPVKDDSRFGTVIQSTGNFELEVVDLSIRGRGWDFDFVRTHRSGAAYSSSLGNTWDFNWNQVIVIEYEGGAVPPNVGGPGASTGWLPPPSGTPPTEGGGHINRGTSPAALGAYYYDGALRVERFGPPETGVALPPGRESWSREPGVFTKLHSVNGGQDLFNDPPEKFVLRKPNGTRYVFGGSNEMHPQHRGLAYRLIEVLDRKGNRTEILYEGSVSRTFLRISEIRDPFARSITFQYESGTDLIESITDFTGRVFRYERDASNNLSVVTSPSVSNDPLGNDYPLGKSTHYVYSDGSSNPNHAHKLVSIINAEEWEDGSRVPYLVNEYDSGGDRVLKQTLGGVNHTGVPAGGVRLLLHEEFADGEEVNWPGFVEKRRVLAVDANGNASLSLFDVDGHDRMTWDFTGRLDPSTVSLSTPLFALVAVNPFSPDPYIDGLLAGTAPLRPTDPKSYITIREFNEDGLVTRIDGPGQIIQLTYDSDTNDAFQAGNLLKREVLPKPDDGSEPQTTLYLYEPYFNQLRAVVDPRGSSVGYVPPNGGGASPGRYLKEFVFDYQEGNTGVGGVQPVSAIWTIDASQASAFAVVGAILPPIADADELGDINGDGAFVYGNVIVERLPSTQVFADPTDPASSFALQVSETTYAYNSGSQRTSAMDARNEVTSFEYYSERDPDGDGVPTVAPPGVSLDSTTGTDGLGFLRQINYPESVSEEFVYDPLGRAVRRTNGRGFSWETTYNSLDQVVHRRDPRGYEEWTAFDWNNNVVETRASDITTTVSATGVPGSEFGSVPISTYFTYDLLGQLLRTSLPEGRNIEKRYDPAGNVTLERSAEFVNQPTEYRTWSYDERNLLFEEAIGGIVSSHSCLQEAAAPTLVESPEKSVSSMSYDFHGNLTSATNGRGLETVRVYDGQHRLVQILSPAGHYTTAEWDVANNRTAVRTFDAGGALWTEELFRFDERNRLFQVDRAFFDTADGTPLADGALTPGDGYASERIAYDANDNVVVTANDNITSIHSEYDGLNRRTREEDGVGNYTLSFYDRADNLIRTEAFERDSSGTFLPPFKTWKLYDELDRMTAEVDNLGITTRYLYDSRGNRVLETDGKSDGTNVPLASLDPFSERTDLVGPTINDHGNAIQYVYDDASREIATIRFLRPGGVGGSTLDTSFAGDGKITTSCGYDLNDRVKTKTDDDGKTTTWEYDDLGRKRRVTYADDTFATWLYDANGNIVRHVDANQTQVDSVYDDADRLMTANRIVSGADVEGVTFESFTWDPLDRLLTGANDESFLRRRYDSLGNVIREEQQVGTGSTRVVHSTFDGAENRTSLVSPARTVSYAFDPNGRLETISEGASVLARYAYVGPERVETRDNEVNGTTTVLAYDGDRRVQGIRHEPTGRPAMAFEDWTFSWDRAHNKSNRTRVNASRSFDYNYDSSYRLVESELSLSGAPIGSVDYALDGVGDRSLVVGGFNPGAYVLSAAVRDDDVHQYTSTPSDSRTYDDNGNLIAVTASGTARSFYDFHNRMVRYEDPATGVSTIYGYDVLGRRLYKDSPTTGRVEYLYSKWDCVEEFDGAGNNTASYVFGAGVDDLITMRRSGVDSYYHADDLGNVMALTDASGSVVERYEYGDFGSPLDGDTLAPLTASSLGNPYLFQGRPFDSESGLYNFRHRYLDATVGRFTTRDALGVWGDPLNLGNAYTYVGNNPWTLRDPSGLGWLMDFVGGVGEGIKDSVTGIVDAVKHPIKTVKATVDAVTHPSRIVDAAKDGIKEFKKNPAKGVGKLVGGVVVGAVPGGAVVGALKVVKATGKLGKVANGVAKVVDDIADAAGGKKVPGNHVDPPKTVGGATKPNTACFIGSTLVALGAASCAPIAELAVGDVVYSKPDPAVNFAPDSSVGASSDPDDYEFIDDDHWRTIRLSMKDGSVDAVLLRPLPWFESVGAVVGETVALELVGLNVIGRARVLEIGPCPPLGEQGPGRRVVTGTFVRPEVEVLEVWIDESSSPISTTEDHPFWSVRANGWTRAGDLTAGDEVRCLNGVARVSRVIRTGTSDSVYNLEVHRDHTFGVGDLAVWVHNDCAMDPGKGPDAAKGGAGARGNGLPGKGGPPDGTLVKDTGHGTGTIRDYDGEGNAKTDYDFHDGEAAGNPHAHDWDWNQVPPRGPARPLKPGE